MALITKIVLFPFAVLYGGIIWLRNGLYKSNFIGSTDFEIPVISIGNLSMGGTGKTPFVELLIELLHSEYKMGVLSRGYKRKTSGYIEVHPSHTAKEAGDEPLMLKMKYPDANVAVGEQRVIAIPQLLATHPDVQVIVLDDAFQHQSVRPDINILLTTYQKPFYADAILPLGTLREWESGKVRANIVVVTKCPQAISKTEQEQIRLNLKLNEKQKVFFATMEYGVPYNILNPSDRFFFDSQKPVLLITGIANAAPLKDFLQTQTKEVIFFKFDDHHFFSEYELENIVKNYAHFSRWITTEKDAVRLALHKDWLIKNNITVYCVPIKTKLIGEGAAEFSKLTKGFLGFFYKTETLTPTDNTKSSENDSATPQSSGDRQKLDNFGAHNPIF